MIVIYACSSDEKPVDNGMTYFPLNVGNYWVYQVSEVIFDTTTQNIVKDYQQKLSVENSFKNSLGEDNYVIYMSQRDNDDDAWEYKETWSVKISSLNELIVNEENIPYVRLIFPVTEGLAWNGNKYNGLEEVNNETNEYKIVDYKQPYNDYLNTVTVEEADELNFVYKDMRYFVYAKDVGLVYHIDSYIDYCNEQNAESNCFGLYIRMHERTKIETLIEHAIQ
jgi:hypothetical protein